jgi:hypothetical protein
VSSALSFGRLEFRPGVGDKPPEAEAPFRIAVLADFVGRTSRSEHRSSEELMAAKPRSVDRDNLDEVLARLDVRLELPLPDSRKTVELAFRTLDEFHPDEIYRQVDEFDDYRESEDKSLLMNALLHHAHFQGLESAWRGLDWLLGRILKKDSRIEVILYDCTREELRADLTGGEDLSTTALYRLLIEEGVLGPKGQPWGLLLGHYIFDLVPADIDLLGRLARISRQAGVPFLADAHPRLLDKSFALDEDTAAQWNALRQLPEAAYLGVALPRFLQRIPYGESGRAIDRFSYEEFTGPGDNCYLWGSTAFLCASLLGQSFNKDGWAMKPGANLMAEGLPLHVWRDEDGDEQVTVAEAWLKPPDVGRLVRLGCMPVQSIRKKDAVQLYRFLSLAQPAKGQEASDLSGRWAQKGVKAPPRAAGPGYGPKVGIDVDAQGAGPPPAAAPAQSEEEAPAAAAEEEASPPEAEEAPPAAEEGMDPELAALLAQMEDGSAAPPEEAAPPAEEPMDPELAALLAQLEGGTAEEAAPPPEEEAMDPELAALLAQLETPDTAAAEPAAEETPPAPEQPAEEMDPELAALLGQLENDTPSEETPATETPAAEEVDPELAALLAQMEGGPSEDPAAEEQVAAPTEEPAAEEVDPELAALLAQMETGTPEEPPAESPATKEVDPELAALLAQAGGDMPPEPAPEEPAAAPAEEPSAEAMDPELAALLGQLEETPSDTAAPATDGDIASQVEILGGLTALEDLGWPMFVPAFAEDFPRQLHILQHIQKNQAAGKEVENLVRKCGGYSALAAEGISPEMGLNEQLQRLRPLHEAREGQKLLTDPEVAAMARAYGASVRSLKTDDDKIEMLRKVIDHDAWAADPRNLDIVNALEGTRFAERRQVQIQQQLDKLGGESAYKEWVRAHPEDDVPSATLEQKTALLKTLKEFNRLGGEAVYLDRAAGAAPGVETIARKLEMLKAALAATE